MDHEQLMILVCEDLAVPLREWALWHDDTYPIFMASVPDRADTEVQDVA